MGALLHFLSMSGIFFVLYRKDIPFVTFVKEVTQRGLTEMEKLCYNQLIKYERTPRHAVRMKQ